MPPPRVTLVDGSSLIYRAFFALPRNLCTASGLHTNAVYGFATMFAKIFAGRTPTYGAVVFDAPGKTFRHDIDPAYKASRPAMPGELREQLPWIDRVVAANHFPVLRAPGYEADDLIGTLARRASSAGMEVVVVSGDKDLVQLIDDRIRVFDPVRDVTYDRELVAKKWGVEPERFADYLALTGDRSDDIPGVPGIGAKGAQRLLAEYGDLDAILAHVDELPGRPRRALGEHAEAAVRSRRLATIADDVPLQRPVDELVIEPPEPGARDALYRELEFYSLLEGDALAKLAAGDGDATACRVARDLAAVESLAGERTAGPPRSIGTLALTLIAVYDPPSYLRGRFVGLAVGWNDRTLGEADRACYVPLSGRDGLGASALEALRPILEDPARAKIVHDYKAVRVLLARCGLTLAGVVGDAMLASFLANPTKLMPHSLDAISKEYLQSPLPPASSVRGSGKAKKPYSELAAADLAPWLAPRMAALATAWPILERELAAASLTGYARDIDLPLAEVLGDMELHGVAVDRDDLEQLNRELHEQMAAIEARVHALAGRQFNVNSPKQLSQVLFEDLGLPVIKRIKSGYSTRSEVLERLRDRHPIAGEVLAFRHVAKLINTYTEVIPRAVDPGTGRVHCTFLPALAATGRIISTEPDLQRTPIRSAEGKRIRRAFIAPPGKRLISADWSQIELRVLAHLSADDTLIDAFERGDDVHRRTAAKIFDVAEDAVSSEQRDTAKTINFATIYGQGASALGQMLGVSRKQAKRYIEAYFSAYSGVRAWLDQTVAEAHQRGYVETLLGRRRYIPELSSAETMVRQAGERMAANTPIQGTAADLCKLAMLAIHRRFAAQRLRCALVLQIHDELVVEAPMDEVETARAIVAECMQTCYTLRVPLVVNIGVGQNWSEAH